MILRRLCLKRIYTIGIHEYLQKDRRMTAEQIKSLPPQWWRTRVRRYIQSPEKIILRLTDWYLYYKDIPDPKVPGRSFFALNHKDVFGRKWPMCIHYTLTFLRSPLQ